MDDMSVAAVKILCIYKDFHSGILKLFKGNFHQGIKPHIIYFSLKCEVITVAIKETHTLQAKINWPL